MRYDATRILDELAQLKPQVVPTGVANMDRRLWGGGLPRGSMSMFVADDLFNSSVIPAMFVRNAIERGLDAVFVVPFSVRISKQTSMMLDTLPPAYVKIRDDLLLPTIETLIQKKFSLVCVLLPENDSWVYDEFGLRRFMKRLFRGNTAVVVFADSVEFMEFAKVKRRYRPFASLCSVRCRVREVSDLDEFVFEFKRTGIAQESFQVSLPRGLL